MGWLPWFILLINQLFVFLGGGGTTLLSEKIHIMRQFWEYELGRGGLLQSVTPFQNKTDDPVWVRWKNRWRCASLFPWYTQLRLFPPRTCCGSSSRRNPNWTTWWVLDVSNISNSAWIESIRVLRNQTHINFYQNWKYWVCFIASHISIKEVSSICAFYSCYKKAAPGSFLMSKITKFTKTTFRALAGSRKMEVPPTPTHHTPQPHTTHHAPHTTRPPHPTPLILYLNWRSPTFRCAPLTAWGSHQSNNKYRRKVFTILEKNTLKKKDWKYSKNGATPTTPWHFSKNNFLLFMMLMLSFFCVGKPMSIGACCLLAINTKTTSKLNNFITLNISQM